MKKLLITIAIAGVLMGAGAVVWLHAAPTVGIAAATPGYIVKNVPTPVTFTVSITDPSLLPGGVNLLQTDSNGKTLATVGVMHDDGLNGDAKAGDKVFSYRLTTNQPSMGVLYYRASAAFKGMLQRAQSNVVPVTIDPVPLPPDPGGAGEQTLAGIDSDHDGIRDDVEREIVLSAPDNVHLQHALMQLAVTQQAMITPGAVTPDQADALQITQDQAIACLIYTSPDPITALRLQQQLKKQLLNTEPRLAAYTHTSAFLGGKFYTPPQPSATTCAF